jgi:hypothetical protein
MIELSNTQILTKMFALEGGSEDTRKVLNWHDPYELIGFLLKERKVFKFPAFVSFFLAVLYCCVLSTTS